MTSILLGAALLVVLALLAVTVLRPPVAPPTTVQQVPDDLRGRVAELEVKVARLPSLWEEERARAERAAARVERASQRATRVHAENARSEDQGGPDAPGLRILDGGPSAQGELPAMPAQLGSPAEAAAALAEIARYTGVRKRRY